MTGLWEMAWECKHVDVLRNELGAGLLLPFWLALAAELEMESGAHNDALATLDEARKIQESTGQRFWDAELHRLKGEALSLGDAAAADVEAAFENALAVARRQGARSLELRAATSLARFRAAGDRRQEAVAVLDEVYAFFVEGFETHDLKAAKSVLASLED